MFTLADFSFAVLSNHLHKPTVAQQVSVNYLSAPKGEKLIAKAVCKKNGRSSSIINVDIVDVPKIKLNVAFNIGRKKISFRKSSIESNGSSVNFYGKRARHGLPSFAFSAPCAAKRKGICVRIDIFNKERR